MNENIKILKEKYPEQVKLILNILLESPYFYRTDNDDLFLFLRRYQKEFREFYRDWFEWELIIDGKCARVHKQSWVNQAIKPARRLQFRLGKRDECIAFMILIEFYEKLLEDNSMTVEELDNPHFKFGDLLEYQQRRFGEVFEKEQEKYTADYLQKNVLQQLMPQLVRYRFLEEIPRPQGSSMNRNQYIYEALPALYHYNTGRLIEGIKNIPLEDFETNNDFNDNIEDEIDE